MQKTPVYFHHIVKLLIVLLGLFAGSVQASTTEEFDLGHNLSWFLLEDSSQNLEINDVSQRNDFTRLTNNLSVGHKKSAFWLRFQIPESGDWFLETNLLYLDHITVFVNRNQHWQATTQGDWHPFSERGIHYRNYLFDLPKTTANQTIFIRVQSSGVVHFKATLWRHLGFIEQSNKDSLLLGFYFALYLPIILMSLFYGIKFHHRLFIFFGTTVTLFSLLIMLQNGLLAQFVWKHNQYQIDNYARGVLICLSFSASVALGCKLLDLNQQRPRLYRYLQWIPYFLALDALSIFTRFYAPGMKIAYFIYISMLFLFAEFSLQKLRQRHINAIFLSILYSSESLIMVGLLLENQGISATTFFSRMAWQLTCGLYAVLGYVILVRRLYHAEAEQARMQAEALLALQQNEKLLKEAVAERTFDLENARVSLETALGSERRMRLEQQQFIAMVTHELRTPLAVIDSAALNLKYSHINPPEKYLRQIHQAVQRIVRLSDNCLAEDRLSNSGFTLLLSRISPKQLIDEAAEIVTWSRHHDLIKQLDDLPKVVEADPTLLRIALSNLLDNAVKYAIPGSIIISGEVQQSFLIFSICDKGPGIAAEELEMIFNRYSQANTKRGGVGLGLFVARAIGKLHGGDLSVKQLPQGGSCFQLSISLTSYLMS